MTKEERKKAKVIEELTKWIDTQVIAKMIISHMEDQDMVLSTENGKQIWLQTLRDIGGGVDIFVSR